MGKKREHMTIEQIKAQVEEEIPYVVGQGTQCVQKRAKRQKELMKRHGHDVSAAVNPVYANGFNSSSINSVGNREVNKSGGTTNLISNARGNVFRGQRVA